MCRRALCYFTLAAILLAAASSAWCAAPWKLILKDGGVIECDGAPLIINDVYMFRHMDGKSGRLAADQVDREKTDQINNVDPRKWRVASTSEPERPSIASPVSASAGLLKFRDADFDAQVLRSATPVMVEFQASWCHYCRQIEPILQTIASEYAGRIRVGQIDIDQSRALAQRYHATAPPTTLIFKDGKVVATLNGYVEKPAVIRFLQSGL